MNMDDIDFKRLSKERKINPTHLAREFAQLEILRRISSSDLRKILCFKGGTALHLIFNMERYSEDLDFSLVAQANAGKILSITKELLSGEDVTDFAIKRKTVLVEIRQQFQPQNFRVKLEINTDNIVPAELKTLYSEYAPASFDLQVMRTDYLVAQKVRALLQRTKGRDLYDLWFILRTKLPVDLALISKLAAVPKANVLSEIETRVVGFNEKKISQDISPFVKPGLRKWVREGLKKDVLQLLRAA